jgi:TusA-related sulfurtransferase
MTIFKGSVILAIADSKPTNNKIKSIITENDRWESKNYTHDFCEKSLRDE